MSRPTRIAASSSGTIRDRLQVRIATRASSHPADRETTQQAPRTGVRRSNIRRLAGSPATPTPNGSCRGRLRPRSHDRPQGGRPAQAVMTSFSVQSRPVWSKVALAIIFVVTRPVLVVTGRTHGNGLVPADSHRVSATRAGVSPGGDIGAGAYGFGHDTTLGVGRSRCHTPEGEMNLIRSCGRRVPLVRMCQKIDRRRSCPGVPPRLRRRSRADHPSC